METCVVIGCFCRAPNDFAVVRSGKQVPERNGDAQPNAAPGLADNRQGPVQALNSPPHVWQAVSTVWQSSPGGERGLPGQAVSIILNDDLQSVVRNTSFDT